MPLKQVPYDDAELRYKRNRRSQITIIVLTFGILAVLTVPSLLLFLAADRGQQQSVLPPPPPAEGRPIDATGIDIAHWIDTHSGLLSAVLSTAALLVAILQLRQGRKRPDRGV
ncbi:hypothetical protein F4553_006312 [Allocatelliglobosispora scoriae]|uniref:Uncharacterized protein n=1 Tax=Allocatelliglobosispora scoriae TaxID=643052 RepID=A0A841BZF8_9ACTN|nr:hypothetical protein [Allocatelliglobosispora scoriae]MBB5872878.1 hypothetical protein [Allocatelliglobosispora scoriae]